MVYDLMFFAAPMPLVVLACGSMSTSKTLRPAAARYVARLMAVVVLPTPPFWFAIAYTFDTGCFRTFHAGLPSRLLQSPSLHFFKEGKKGKVGTPHTPLQGLRP